MAQTEQTIITRSDGSTATHSDVQDVTILDNGTLRVIAGQDDRQSITCYAAGHWLESTSALVGEPDGPTP